MNRPKVVDAVLFLVCAIVVVIMVWAWAEVMSG